MLILTASASNSVQSFRRCCNQCWHIRDVLTSELLKCKANPALASPSRVHGNFEGSVPTLGPHRKMKSRHESYQQLMTSPSAKGSDSSCPGGGPLPRVAGNPTPRGGVPYPAWRGVTRKEHRIEHRNRTRKAEEGTTRPISSLSLLPEWVSCWE